MMDVVDATLTKWRQTEFQYGQSDCLLSVGDYLTSIGATDVASQYRGSYDTADQAAVILATGGGFGAFLALTGAVRVYDAPARGDVLLIAPNDVTGDRIAGVCTGTAVALRRDGRGMIEIGLRHITLAEIWRF